MWGQGLVEGKVKRYLPDSHTDFIFAVIGEEFGFLGAVFFIFIYSFIIFALLAKIKLMPDNFHILALSGLITQFAFQIFLNLGVNLGLLPTKGATLPFVSYGGSSTLAMAVIFGTIFALTKKHVR